MAKSIKIRRHGEKENYRYLGILEADTIKHAEIKEQIKKLCFRRRRKLHETKLLSRHLIKGINNRAVLLVRYLGLILNWRKDSRQMNQGTRNFMTMPFMLDMTRPDILEMI